MKVSILYFNPIAIVVVSVLLLGFNACSDKTADPETSSAEKTTSSPAATATDSESSSPLSLPPGEALQAGSIYDIDSSWRNTSGEDMKLSDLGGKVRVVAMGYSSCKYACPRLVGDMRNMQEKLAADTSLKGKVGFVFISIDPENDTPEKLKAYAESNKFDVSNDWIMLTGDEDSVLELAVVIGMKYRKADATDFAHSNIITILDEKGNIVHQQFGLGTESDETIAAIHAAVEGSDAP